MRIRENIYLMLSALFLIFCMAVTYSPVESIAAPERCYKCEDLGGNWG